MQCQFGRPFCCYMRRFRQKLGVFFGSPVCHLGGYTFFHLHCYLKPSRQCAGNCVRWAGVSMTCTVVRPITREF